jgi:multidrug efflux pump subunit AcrA (membrane-fusion protein)
LPKLAESFALIATTGQRKQLDILKQKESRLQLRATRAGTVDRIMKEPGEYVKAGEGILKIVGDPVQIVGFLPQDQLHSITVGKEVFITPTRERNRIEPSKIKFLAPRMNTVPDSTSPIPNKRLFGQDVVCDLPPGLNLLPGQTVIIHLDDPRSVPILTDIFRKIFHNEDLE